jgi:putative phosphoribosyl transferase
MATTPQVIANQTFRDATVVRDHVSLAVKLWLPTGKPPFPGVIFVHGLGSTKESPRNVVIAKRLLETGIAAVLFDLSGHGESSSDRREDERAFIEDIDAVFHWAAQQPELDLARLAVAGSSLGGVVALHAATRHLVHPAAMVLRAPPVEPHDFVRLAVPTLVVIGSMDSLLPRVRAAVELSEEAFLRVVPGAGHLFEEPGALETATAETVRWFEAQLIQRGEPPETVETGEVDCPSEPRR